MANTNMTEDMVKSTCHKLEISPSKGDSHGESGGAPGVTPGHHGGGANKNHAHESNTSEFKMTDRGMKISQYSKQFAKTAPEF